VCVVLLGMQLCHGFTLLCSFSFASPVPTVGLLTQLLGALVRCRRWSQSRPTATALFRVSYGDFKSRVYYFGSDNFQTHIHSAFHITGCPSYRVFQSHDQQHISDSNTLPQLTSPDGSHILLICVNPTGPLTRPPEVKGTEVKRRWTPALPM